MEKVFEFKNSSLKIFQIKDKEIIKIINSCIELLYNKKILQTNSEILIGDKICHRQRNVCNFSDVVETYPNSNIKSLQLEDCFKELLNYINLNFNTDNNNNLNSILINEYTDGNHYIGRHSDKEVYSKQNNNVIALSVGVGRKFRIRKIGYDYDEKGKKHIPPVIFEHITGNYEIMIMEGAFQLELTHEIPKELKIKETRISFTFRQF
jgi:alkylated DNA repair dioxygenase AlkB